MRSLLAAIFIFIPACSAQERTRDAPDSPTFAKYRVSLAFRGPNAPVKLTGDAWTYRTRLRAAAKSGPSFADHYALSEWGCGSGCIEFAVIDLVDGRVTFFPESVSWVNESDPGLHARRDSKAIHVVGAPNEEDSADRWYAWTGKTFRLISRKPARLEQPEIEKPE